MDLLVNIREKRRNEKQANREDAGGFGRWKTKALLLAGLLAPLNLRQFFEPMSCHKKLWLVF